MKKIIILPAFERSIKRFNQQQKDILAKSLVAFNSYVITGKANPGFRFKKINHDKYEFRVDIKLRVIVKADGNNYYLVLAGNHDDVRRYLRDFR